MKQEARFCSVIIVGSSLASSFVLVEQMGCVGGILLNEQLIEISWRRGAQSVLTALEASQM